MNGPDSASGDAVGKGLHSDWDVVVDDREQASDVIEQLRTGGTLRVSIRRLKLGDYLVANRVLVERKTVADLSASIVDGRLFRQACCLANSLYRPLVIIEGPAFDETAAGVSQEAIHGALVALTLLLGIPCLRTRDARETANLIRYAGEQTMKHIRHAVYRHGYRPHRRRNRQLYILQGLPGVGPARAECLLDTFGSIQAVCSADVDSLAAVKGLGRKTAAAIRAVVGPDSDSERRTAEDDPASPGRLSVP